MNRLQLISFFVLGQILNLTAETIEVILADLKAF